jgi:hypothetical protein
MARALSRRPGLLAALFATVVAVGTLALVLPQGTPRPRAHALPRLEQPPRPAPLEFLQLDPATARDLNAAVPFRPLGPAARPFFLPVSGDTRERALACLASAMWYDAGDDARGQYAVAQVVLNRMRHPAFPASVCGVVFQGAERHTGCQFTFTCDGALARPPSTRALADAGQRAEEMLGGRVDPEVGLATHYHTDWVHPLWSPELEKIAQVETHLFFRWGGGWGGPSVMRQHYAGVEPVAAALAPLFAAHAMTPNGMTALPPALADAASGPMTGGGAHYELAMSPLRNGNVQAMKALDLCADSARCSVTGYLDEGGVKGPVVFTFERDRDRKIERARWDCSRFRRPTTTQCMAR